MGIDASNHMLTGTCDECGKSFSEWAETKAACFAKLHDLGWRTGYKILCPACSASRKPRKKRKPKFEEPGYIYGRFYIMGDKTKGKP